MWASSWVWSLVNKCKLRAEQTLVYIKLAKFLFKSSDTRKSRVEFQSKLTVSNTYQLSHCRPLELRLFLPIMNGDPSDGSNPLGDVDDEEENDDGDLNELEDAVELDETMYDSNDIELDFPWANGTETLLSTLGPPKAQKSTEDADWKDSERRVGVLSDPGWMCYQIKEGYVFRREDDPKGNMYIRTSTFGRDF